MQRFRNHLAVPVFLIFLAINAYLLLDIRAAKDDGMFILQDKLGERSQLGDVVIHGDLGDAFHRTRFEITSTEVNTSTEIYDIPVSQLESIRAFAGDSIKIGGIYYEITGGPSNFEIFLLDERDWNNRKQGTATVETAIQPINFTENYMNTLDYGLTKMGETFYYTVPTTDNFTGTNGIFELHFNEDHFSYAPKVEYILSNPITNYDITSGMNVLGLEAVGDNLVLLVLEDSQLIFQGYNRHGEKIGEASVMDFPIQRQTHRTHEEEAHFPNYTAYVDDENDTLTVSFLNNRSEEGNLYKSVVSVQVASEIDVVNVANVNISDGEQDRHYGVTEMIYKYDKLYIAVTLRESREDRPMSSYFYWPIQFMIYVYEESELVYHGELETNMSDDMIQAINIRGHGYSYSWNDHRHFSNIKIK